MTIPEPQDLGLPSKFGRWRPGQIEALRFLLTSRKRVKALSAPTGFGKTPVEVAYALITKQPTCFVTDSRGLQDQMMADFRSIGMVDIRGRRNYDCNMRPETSCEEGYALRCPYKGTIMCPSSQAEMRAATSSLVVTNYDKWTAAKKYGQGMEHFTQVVFDEGHQAPQALARAVSVTLNYAEVENMLGLDFLPAREAEEFVNWVPWAAHARAAAEEAMLAARAKMLEVRAKPAWVREYLHCRNLSRRLAMIATANPNNWIADDAFTAGKHTGYQFDPVRPGRYAEGLLLLRVPSIVVVSATLRPKTLFMCGMSKETFDYAEFESDFDPKRCPIYYVPTMRVDARHSDYSLLWARLDQLAARRTDRKGIVHTVSYIRAGEVSDSSRYAQQMLISPRELAPAGLVARFKRAEAGTLLVSPSVGAGYDFPLTECEWQFLCKIPFAPGQSKIVRARQEDDKEYGPYLAMNKMVQIFGRGMRSQEDQCENFICDEHLDWFLPRFGHLAPKWFHRFFKRVSVLPPPPPALAQQGSVVTTL